MTKKSTSKKTHTTRRTKNHELRNKLERKVNERVAACFGEDASRYESLTLVYTVPETTHKYTPDFPVGNTIFEAKGLWDPEDRKKMLLVSEQYPQYRFVMVFLNPNQKIRKGSKTSYANWCDKKGIAWLDSRTLTVEQLEAEKRKEKKQ